MIQANELRIGNWVQVYDTNYQIHAIMSDEYPLLKTIEFGAYSLSYNDLQPIPLTEEWLVKFGFDDLGDYGYGKGNFHICLYDNEFYFPINNRRIFIQHVNSLQNLFFALTGEELTLKS